MDDASLDDFLDAGSAASDEADADAEPSDETEETLTESGEASAADAETEATVVEGEDASEDNVETSGDPAAVAPAASTMTFSPDPGECAACGASVARRWTDGDALVCRDCKEW